MKPYVDPSKHADHTGHPDYNHAMIGLAYRALACGLPRAEPGMVLWLGVDNGPRFECGVIADGGDAIAEYRWYPMVHHPATLGIIDARMRAAWAADGHHDVEVGHYPLDGRWRVRVSAPGGARLAASVQAPTQPEALIMAWEKAKQRLCPGWTPILPSKKNEEQPEGESAPHEEEG